ncbi:MAG: hypothetical protein ACHQ50_13895, partial [Fimbriimonadales bacterium]
EGEAKQLVVARLFSLLELTKDVTLRNRRHNHRFRMLPDHFQLALVSLFETRMARPIHIPTLADTIMNLAPLRTAVASCSFQLLDPVLVEVVLEHQVMVELDRAARKVA